MVWHIFVIVGLTVLAGAFIPLGGLLARVEKIGSDWLEQEFRHFLIALGGRHFAGCGDRCADSPGQGEHG